MKGFNGKIAFVDLTTRAVIVQDVPESTYRASLGGAGLGAWFLYHHMKPGVDPLGPENILGLMSGALSGTGMPMASKFLVVGKSPLTGTWGEANCGGSLAAKLKAAGYDALFVRGVSPEPVWILVDDGEIQFKDAKDLWGKDTADTVVELMKDTGEKGLGIACIGPAGESCSLISSIVSDNGRVAGRSGLGAVMGSKRLKAVAVKGSGKVDIADKEAFERLRKGTLDHLRDLDNLPFLNSLSKIGTCGGPLVLVPMGASPIKNWSLLGKDAFPDYEKIAGESITRYQLRKTGCGNCPINCGGTVQVKDGLFATRARKPEYETIAAFGTMPANTDPESIIKGNELCDRFGLDTISTGAVIAFAMECYERGVIGKEDTGGIEFTWGNAPGIVGMIEKIARREGLGDILADGVRVAAERIGKDSEQWAIHVHGQEPGYHDPRLFDLRGLGYITGAAPGRHLISEASIRLEQEGKLGPYPELTRPEDKDEKSLRGVIHAMGLTYGQAFSDTGMCLFALSWGSNIALAEIISAVSGWDYSPSELLTTGKRTVTLRQLFNLREGLKPQDFTLPPRIASPPESGPLKGKKVDFEALRRSFFNAMEWHPETGIPTAECLEELGLQECLQGLA
ncbi:MAG: aldehyde ferredoxin oxidoreductase family protein [Deltaproteobacteria bacterium]|nr:aldehyde ferredoxin oxidoreductase family protein [Deltaproteobacteria bacterium]